MSVQRTQGIELFDGAYSPGLRELMFSRVPTRFGVALVGLVLVSSLLLSPPLSRRELRSGTHKTEVAASITTPQESPRAAAVSPGPPRVGKRPRVERGREVAAQRISIPDHITADTLIHTARRGESFTSIARRYVSRTLFMTVPELEAAMRQANGAQDRKSLSPGDPVTIPGYLTVPVIERPIPMAKDYEVRAIYLTGGMAGSKQGIHLIRRWRELGGNAIVFDVKDSDGSLSVPFNHELAPKLPPHIQNLPKFTRFLHILGLHAIARIALFRDELMVRHHPQLAVWSRRSNQAWRENGKLVWTDPSRPEVQDYNIALARLAASSGVDEVQFDYVRFPAEGDQKDAKFYFQTVHPEWQRSQVISDFLSRAYSELHPLGVLVSLDVFGVMAWRRPADLVHTGQDIAAMARFCDVLSPMIYPSHFFGMDGYARPGDAPEHFIAASMERFQEVTLNTGVVLRPWLQAFAWRTRTYSPEYILRQIAVSKEKDGIGYLFWNARNDYSKPFVAMLEMRSSPARSSRKVEAGLGQAARATIGGDSPAHSESESAAPHSIVKTAAQ